ncbi:unnamed protein product [Polarella glacialis]|nr:unnamed protein product [Polarella glacialis]
MAKSTRSSRTACEADAVVSQELDQESVGSEPLSPVRSEESRRSRMKRLILLHQLSILSISLLTLQPRNELLLQAFGGDTAATSRHIGRGAALVALSDFIISPSAGAFSDFYGRKPLMLLAPGIALPLKLATALMPTPAMLMLDRVLGDSLRTLGGTTMAYACLADLYSGPAYAAALGQLNAASGLGLVLAPLVASAVMGPSGAHPRRAYLVAALLAALHLFVGSFLLEETNMLRALSPSPATAASLASSSSTDTSSMGLASLGDASDRRPTLKPVWTFLRLFTQGSRLRMRAFLLALHCFVEGKVIQDQASMLQLSNGWGASERSRWTSSLGLAILVGGQCSGYLLRWVGEHNFTSACHLTSFLAFMSFRRSSFWWGLILLVLGQQRRLISSSWVVKEASDTLGIGKGEVIGWIASLRGVAEAISAMLFAGALRAATSRGTPVNAFLLPAGLVALAEFQRSRIALHDDGEELRRQTSLQGISSLDDGRRISAACPGVVRLRIPPRSPREPLGLGLDLLDACVPQVCTVARGSFVDTYNATVSDEKRLKVGDFLIEINGISGEALIMADLLQSEGNTALEVAVQRPQEFSVSVSAHGAVQSEAGADSIASLPSGLSLYIEKLQAAELLFQGFNVKVDASSPDLRQHDRIVAVNKVRGKSEQLREAFSSAVLRKEPFNLSILRPV